MISSTVERVLSLLKWSPRTDTKVFASILLPGLCSNTDAFLTLYRSGVFQTSSPLAAMSRFAVKSITLHNINNAGSEDEYLGYLFVRVEDLEQRKPYNFIIKHTRTGSPDNRLLSESQCQWMKYLPLHRTFPSHLPYPLLLQSLNTLGWRVLVWPPFKAHMPYLDPESLWPTTWY
jgi:hypothetical protein